MIPLAHLPVGYSSEMERKKYVFILAEMQYKMKSYLEKIQQITPKCAKDSSRDDLFLNRS